MDEEVKKLFETNKATWNEKVSIHAQSAFYDVEGFKQGKCTLNAYELDALLPVAGKSILHLQCHFGLDTLSWQKLGASCTGVDLSDKAIALGRALNKELGLHAKFECCNVLDTSAHIDEKFDIVFTSYGTIGWLPDLNPWAQMIAERLKPGGVFYIVDFHPITWMFDYNEGRKEMRYGYNQSEVIYDEYEGTYAETSSKMISKEYGWNHGIASILMALINAGLNVEFFKEHDESPYDIFPDLEQQENGLYVTKDRLYPLLFELKVTKPQ